MAKEVAPGMVGGRPMIARAPKQNVKAAVVDRENDVLAAFGIDTRKLAHHHCPFPDHEDRRPSWRWNHDRRRWFCTCGSGDIFDAVMRLTGGTFRDAAECIGSILGPGPDEAPPRPPQRPQKRRRKPERRDTLAPWARALWAACRPIRQDDVAARYLGSRGCALPPVEGDLRWHPEHRHPCGQAGPCLVALVTDVINAQAISLHQTWIHPSGVGKALFDRPRLLLPGHRKLGGCVRLWPDEEVTDGLAIAEGIETALAAARAFRPTWRSTRPTLQPSPSCPASKA